MGHESANNSKPKDDSIFLMFCINEGKKDTEMEKLQADGLHPESRQIIGGPLDGQYMISVPVIEGMLLLRQNIEKFSKIIARTIERYSNNNIYHNIPLGKVAIAYYRWLIENSEFFGYSSYQIQMLTNNINILTKHGDILNRLDFRGIEEALYLEKTLGPLNGTENEHAQNMDAAQPASNVRDTGKIFGDDADARYSPADLNRLYVYVAEINANDEIWGNEYEEFRQKGYHPYIGGVPHNLGNFYPRTRYRLFLPFYAYCHNLYESFRKLPGVRLDIPLGDIVYDDLMCSDIIQKYPGVLKAIEDNQDFLNKYKLRNAEKLFAKWLDRTGRNTRETDRRSLI